MDAARRMLDVRFLTIVMCFFAATIWSDAGVSYRPLEILAFISYIHKSYAYLCGVLAEGSRFRRESSKVRYRIVKYAKVKRGL